MAVYEHGKDTNVNVDTAADSLTAIETDLTNSSLSRPKDNAVTTTMGSTAVSRVAGVPEGGTFSYEGFATAARDLHMDGILGNDSIGGALCDITVLPDGSSPTYTMTGSLSTYSISTSTGAPATFSASHQLSGAVTRS